VESPEEYRIITWSSDGIISAKYETDSADWDLRISIKDKTVEKAYRETKVRGYEKADPNIAHTWILE
jgi:hypothetical protein